MTEHSIRTDTHPLRVAVIGSGPSGFYAAEELLTQTEPKVKVPVLPVPSVAEGRRVEVDMFDRLPTPFGLVRGGVAPDHQKIKSVIRVYEKTAARKGFRFFGNVEFGKDLQLEDFKKHYDAIIFAVGAKSDRKMGIPGEDLKGSCAATEFVGWYNGHPDYRDLQFDLSVERVAVVGIGNVAIDVARILAVDPDAISSTDIADYALESLKKSRVKDIYFLGRRGPAQAAFTNQEIRELCVLKGAELVVNPRDAELDELSQQDLANGVGGVVVKNNVQILADHSKKDVGTQSKKIHLRFLVSPVEILGDNGKVSAIKLEKNKLQRGSDGSLRPEGTGEFEVLPVDFILRSVGYKGVPLPGLPYDERKGTIPNQMGRVIDPQTKNPIPGLYVVGWAKRGPTGVIGTNKPDSIETAKKVLEDFSILSSPQDVVAELALPQSQASLATTTRDEGKGDIVTILKQKNIRTVSFEEWKALDAIEIENGKSKGKVREKFTAVAEMLTALNQRQGS